MNCIWNEKERQFIREHAGKIKDTDLAAQLTQMTGRRITLQSLRKQRRKLGIIKARGRGICQISDRPIKFSEKRGATSEKTSEKGINLELQHDKDSNEGGAEEKCVQANQAR